MSESYHRNDNCNDNNRNKNSYDNHNRYNNNENNYTKYQLPSRKEKKQEQMGFQNVIQYS